MSENYNEHYIVTFYREVDKFIVPGCVRTLMVTYEQAEKIVSHIKSSGAKGVSILEVDLSKHKVSFMSEDATDISVNCK